MSRIYISPSNQNNNPYSYGGTNEMEQCYKIGQACNTALKRCGFTTMLADKGQAMYTSINESNNFNADVHICIHTNAGGGKGAEVMVFDRSSVNLKYAQPVYNELSALTGNGRGIKLRPELAEINSTNGVCVYCECEFHDSRTLAKWIVENTATIGEAIAKGICKAFGVAYKSPSSKTEKPVVEDKKENKMPNTAKPDVIYKVKADGKWYPEVKNLKDYAGVVGKPITDVAIKVTKGTVKYRVHILNGNWLPYVTGYNANDYVNGYAGNGKPIDAVEIYYSTPSDYSKTNGYLYAKYRVSPVKKSYYDWQLDNEKSSTMDGYAGLFGQRIDRIQIVLE